MTDKTLRHSLVKNLVNIDFIRFDHFYVELILFLLYIGTTGIQLKQTQ